MTILYIYIHFLFLYNIRHVIFNKDDLFFVLFQTEKHNEIMDKISHLTNRLKEAQESIVKEKESNEDSLDAFMSSLNSSILSKSDVTKMKVELQNLRKEEMKLIKLINLAKPANLPPLVSQVQTEDKKHETYQGSKFSIKKSSQLERRRKLFESNVSDHSATCHLLFYLFVTRKEFFLKIYNFPEQR